MKGNNFKEPKFQKLLYKNEESKVCLSKKAKNIFFNSVTGEEITSDIENEEDMYEIIPDLEQYAKDNITQFVVINEKDKQFFILWNSFIKSNEKENKFISFDKIIINFIKLHNKELYENHLKKNFILHLVCIYENHQINDENLKKIIDLMDRLFGEYENKN